MCTRCTSGGPFLRSGTSLCKLIEKFCCQSLHLLLKHFPILLNILRAHVASGGQHIIMGSDLVEGRALAEAGDVLVGASVLLAAPGVVGACHALYLFVGELAVRAIGQVAQLAHIDKEHLVAAVAEPAEIGR